jgi:hypothetical protein
MWTTLLRLSIMSTGCGAVAQTVIGMRGLSAWLGAAVVVQQSLTTPTNRIRAPLYGIRGSAFTRRLRNPTAFLLLCSLQAQMPIVGYCRRAGWDVRSLGLHGQRQRSPPARYEKARRDKRVVSAPVRRDGYAYGKTTAAMYCDSTGVRVKIGARQVAIGWR